MPPRYQRAPPHRAELPAPPGAPPEYPRLVPTDTPEELAQAFAAAICTRDVPAAVALWAEDAAILQPDGQVVRGREAIAQALQTLVDNRVELQIDVSSVIEAGDVATVLGTLTLSAQNGGGPEDRFTSRSSSVVIYTRGADGWRIALDAPWGLPTPRGTS
jgi:uncharacterized protein (TIGR02246 family)